MPRKSSSTPSTSGYKQRKSGGTTGRPRVPRSDRNQPIVSLRVNPNPTPAHGVSGYPTTGLAGGFNRQQHVTGVPTDNTNPAASRYSMESVVTPVGISQGTDFNYATPAPPIRPGMGNVSNLTAEPAVQQRLDFSETPSTASAMARNQILQSQGGGARSSFVEEQAYLGRNDNDMYLQTTVPGMQQGGGATSTPGQPVTPAQGARINLFPRPTTTPRQDDQASGTTNAEASITPFGPEGQGNLQQINARHTPQYPAAGYASAGTHHSHGPQPHANYDGSWTIDVMPGQRPIMLTDLPPAADIPVQTYSGYTPANTSAEYMRPSGGSLITPKIQRAAIFA